MLAPGNETLTNSHEDLISRKQASNAEFQRSVRMYKLQNNMGMVEKHTVEITAKKFRAEKQQEKERALVIGSPTPDKRFGPKIHIN